MILCNTHGTIVGQDEVQMKLYEMQWKAKIEEEESLVLSKEKVNPAELADLSTKQQQDADILHCGRRKGGMYTRVAATVDLL